MEAYERVPEMQTRDWMVGTRVKMSFPKSKVLSDVKVHLRARVSANNNIRIRTYKQQCRKMHLGTGKQRIFHLDLFVNDLVSQSYVSKKEMEIKTYIHFRLTLVQG